MTHARTGDLVAAAVSRDSSVLALNVITLEHAEGILLGAARAGVPVILQVSENAIRYHDGRGEPLLSACSSLVESHAATASLHLDHLTDLDLLDLAVDGLGVSSVMYDASALPYADNETRTREVAQLLHERGLWVEAELGAIGGKGGAHTPGVRTDPAEAAAYVAATGVDALAVAVGSSHAMTTQTATVDCALVTAIAAATPVPLVLHGSSGVPVAQLKEATRAGIRKVNVGTALNVAFTSRVRAALEADPALTDPRRYLEPAREGVADLVVAMLRDLSGVDPEPVL
jgi:fructose-bisphosphate aldolase class II